MERFVFRSRKERCCLDPNAIQRNTYFEIESATYCFWSAATNDVYKLDSMRQQGVWNQKDVKP